jgi:hypothetical protein
MSARKMPAASKIDHWKPSQELDAKVRALLRDGERMTTEHYKRAMEETKR